MSRTNKNPYTKSKRFDVTCRNHGSCSYCRDNRLYSSRHRERISGIDDPSDNDIFDDIEIDEINNYESDEHRENYLRNRNRVLSRNNASKKSLDLWMSDSLKKSVDMASVPTVLVGRETDKIKFINNNIDTVKRLISLCDEPSVKIPAGMTREERRAWAKQSQKMMMQK